MRKILLASHGKLASGIKSSIKILTGREDQIETIDAYIDESDFTAQIQGFINSVDKDQESYIFTDIYGGSVNQKVVSKVIENNNKNIHIITGMNLPVVLSILLESGEISNKRLLEIIQGSQVKLVSAKTNDNSEKDFFE